MATYKMFVFVFFAIFCHICIFWRCSFENSVLAPLGGYKCKLRTLIEFGYPLRKLNIFMNDMIVCIFSI